MNRSGIYSDYLIALENLGSWLCVCILYNCSELWTWFVKETLKYLRNDITITIRWNFSIQTNVYLGWFELNLNLVLILRQIYNCMEIMLISYILESSNYWKSSILMIWLLLILLEYFEKKITSVESKYSSCISLMSMILLSEWPWYFGDNISVMKGKGN